MKLAPENVSYAAQAELHQLEDPESVVEQREKEALAEAIKTQLRELVDQRFGKEGKESLDYHGPEHSFGVAQDAIDLLTMIQEADPSLVQDGDILLVELEALAHDLVLESNTEGMVRTRDRGAAYEDESGEMQSSGAADKVGNESKSAIELLTLLESMKSENGKELFPVSDPKFRAAVAADIAATYPDFSFHPETGLKVFQPHLKSESSLRAWALATADLRGVYRRGKDPRGFVQHGDAEFRETRVQLGRDVTAGLEALPPKRKAEIVKDILGWKNTQISFATWQEKLFQQSVAEQGKLKDNSVLQERLLEQFDFAPAIALAQSEAANLKSEYADLTTEEAFEESVQDQRLVALLEKMGYELS